MARQTPRDLEHATSALFACYDQDVDTGARSVLDIMQTPLTGDLKARNKAVGKTFAQMLQLYGAEYVTMELQFAAQAEQG